MDHAGEITTPLMVVQGANDPRAKKAESEQIVIVLRDRGYPVPYLCVPEEGHGFARPGNNMALMAAIEAILATPLGGRFQVGLSPEVGRRPKDIPVDSERAALARKPEGSAGNAVGPSK